MLGDTSKSIGEGKTVPNITQAAFIRNLIATFIKTTSNKGLGGIFGSKLLDEYNTPLNWNRTQQSAFIIFVWSEMFKAVKSTQAAWALSLRGNNYQPKDYVNQDPAFDSKYSLLSSDQGVRGFLHIINDMIYKKAKEKELRNVKWQIDNEEIKEDRIDPKDLKLIIEDFGNSSISPFVNKICEELI